MRTLRQHSKALGKMSGVVQQILGCIDHGGLHISEAELRYQLRRRGMPTGDLLEQLMALEEQGLIESSLFFRLTDDGRANLPADHEAPVRVGTPTSWSVR